MGVVDITYPKHNTLTPNDSLKIVWSHSDDITITKAEVHYSIDGVDWKVYTSIIDDEANKSEDFDITNLISDVSALTYFEPIMYRLKIYGASSTPEGSNTMIITTPYYYVVFTKNPIGSKKMKIMHHDKIHSFNMYALDIENESKLPENTSFLRLCDDENGNVVIPFIDLENLDSKFSMIADDKVKMHFPNSGNKYPVVDDWRNNSNVGYNSGNIDINQIVNIYSIDYTTRQDPIYRTDQIEVRNDEYQIAYYSVMSYGNRQETRTNYRQMRDPVYETYYTYRQDPVYDTRTDTVIGTGYNYEHVPVYIYRQDAVYEEKSYTKYREVYGEGTYNVYKYIQDKYTVIEYKYIQDVVSYNTYHEKIDEPIYSRKSYWGNYKREDIRYEYKYIGYYTSEPNTYKYIVQGIPTYGYMPDTYTYIAVGYKYNQTGPFTRQYGFITYYNEQHTQENYYFQPTYSSSLEYTAYKQVKYENHVPTYGRYLTGRKATYGYYGTFYYQCVGNYYRSYKSNFTPSMGSYGYYLVYYSTTYGYNIESYTSYYRGLYDQKITVYSYYYTQYQAYRVGTETYYNTEQVTLYASGYPLTYKEYSYCNKYEYVSIVDTYKYVGHETVGYKYNETYVGYNELYYNYLSGYNTYYNTINEPKTYNQYSVESGKHYAYNQYSKLDSQPKYRYLTGYEPYKFIYSEVSYYTKTPEISGYKEVANEYRYVESETTYRYVSYYNQYDVENKRLTGYNQYDVVSGYEYYYTTYSYESERIQYNDLTNTYYTYKYNQSITSYNEYNVPSGYRDLSYGYQYSYQYYS